MRIIAPSMLSADFSKLGEEIKMINNSKAEWIHLDIMDGVFVPNISYGFPVVKSIKSLTNKVLDAHLMIVNPDNYIERFAEYGAGVITVHYEACTHVHRTLNRIKEIGAKAGLALNPHTPVSCLEEIIVECDMVLIMSVNPGYGGQKFIPFALQKVKRVREMANKYNSSLIIQVDGGVDFNNAADLFNAGANVLVAGNTVFSHKSPQTAIEMLLNV